MKNTIFLFTFLILIGGTLNAQKIKSIKDRRDGTTYKTVKIGKQWWMAENLSANTFNDGTEIALITKNEDWLALQTPAFSWYENNEITYKTYGILYNWYAVNTEKLCPRRWHIPTESEWQQLEITLGLSLEEAQERGIRGNPNGGKLKAKTHWESPNTDANNESGFAGLPEGHRNWQSGGFIDLELFGTWWSSTEEDSSTAWRRTLHYNDSNIRRFTSHKRDGFSVRCVKD